MVKYEVYICSWVWDWVAKCVLWEVVDVLDQYMVFGSYVVPYLFCISHSLTHSSSFTSKYKAVVLSQKS